MVKKTYSVAISLTDRQKKRLVQGYGIRLNTEQLSGGDIEFAVDGKRHRRMTKAHKTGKSYILRMTREELEGSGLWAKIKNAFYKIADFTFDVFMKASPGLDLAITVISWSVVKAFGLDTVNGMKHFISLCFEAIRAFVPALNFIPHDIWMKYLNEPIQQTKNIISTIAEYAINLLHWVEAGADPATVKQYINETGQGIPHQPTQKIGGTNGIIPIVGYNRQTGNALPKAGLTEFNAAKVNKMANIIMVGATIFEAILEKLIAKFLPKAINDPHLKSTKKSNEWVLKHKKLVSWMITIFVVILILGISVATGGFLFSEVILGLGKAFFEWGGLLLIQYGIANPGEVKFLSEAGMNIFSRLLGFTLKAAGRPTPPIPMKKSRSKKGPIDQIPEGYQCAPFSMFQSGEQVHCKYVPKTKSGSGMTGPVNKLPAGYTCAPNSMYLSNGVAYCTYQRKGKIPDWLV